MITEHGQQSPNSLCVNMGGECLLPYQAIGDAVEKVVNIQFQHHRFSHMYCRIAQCGAAESVSGGVWRNGHMGQKNIRNAALNSFQHSIRHHQVSHPSGFLRNGNHPIVPSQGIADSIEGFGGDSQITLKGGKLPVYNHLTFLP